MKWTLAQIEELLEAFYGATVKQWSFAKKLRLSKGLYLTIGDYLKTGLYKNFSPEIALQFGAADQLLLKELTNNLYLFSRAKTINFVLSADGVMVEDGKLLPVNEYLKRARPVFEKYNDNWLTTEYNTTVGTGQRVVYWRERLTQVDIYPLERWVTSGDERVCPICEALDGITKPTNDPFWAKYQPRRVHYDCHCTSEPLKEGAITNLKGMKLPEPSLGMASNPAVTGEVFDKSHPYISALKPEYKAYLKPEYWEK